MGRVSLYYNTVKNMKPSQVVNRLRIKLGKGCPLGVAVSDNKVNIQKIESPEDLDFDPVFLSRFPVAELMEDIITILHSSKDMNWKVTWNFEDKTALWGAFRLAKRSSTRVLGVTGNSIIMEMTDQKGQTVQREIDFRDEFVITDTSDGNKINQLAAWLDGIEENIRNGKYSSELFTEIIRYIAELKSLRVMPERCDAIFHAMKDYLQVADPTEIIALDKEHYLLDAEAGKIFKSMCDQLDALVYKAQDSSEKTKYSKAIENEKNWGTNLLEASANTGTISGHSFVYWLDPERIVKLISDSDNAELMQFRKALQSVYDKSVYYKKSGDDIKHLVEIHNGVKRIDISSWGAIKKVYHGWILEDLDKYLERLGYEPDNERLLSKPADIRRQTTVAAKCDNHGI